MAMQLEHEDGTGIKTLVTGIIHDGQELMRQHLRLFQAELKNDLRQTRDASIALGIGAVIAGMGAFLLTVTLALFINYMWPQTIPLWGAMGMVGGGLLLIGIVFLLVAKARFDAFSPLPDKSLDALKETFSWKTKT